MKKTFQEVFKVHPNGSIEPNKIIRVGGVQFGPGVKFGMGVTIGGIDLTVYAGHDLEIEEDSNGVGVLKGIY